MSKILLSNDEIEMLFKLYVLLYADDTVIFAESKEELQSALNAMYLFCKSWDLEVNPTKTKVTVFCNRKFEHNMTFIYNGQDLDIEDGFVYTVFSVTRGIHALGGTRNLTRLRRWRHLPC